MRLPYLASTTALLLGGLLAAGAAHAGPQVQFQVTLETPVLRLGHLALPLPPIPVPRAVIVGPSYEPRGHAGPVRWDADGDGVPNRNDPVYNPRWDRDGDGVPNRRDPVYNPRWDRDGDGVPNRRDPVYNPRWDRDGDGVPNRYDPRPGDPRNGRAWQGHDGRRDWRDQGPRR
jgi:hypothetical protein